MAVPDLARPTSVSGIATTASFSAKRATRIAVWPEATTWPGSIRVAVTTPRVSAAQRCIRERVLGEFDRTLGAIEARARLIGRRTALIHLRIGGPALGAQILGALLGGGSLRQHAGGGAEFGLGLLGLQLQIDFIEGGERLADIDGLADLDQALGYLAGDAKAHVGLDPGLDGADKAALWGLGLDNAR